MNFVWKLCIYSIILNACFGMIPFMFDVNMNIDDPLNGTGLSTDSSLTRLANGTLSGDIRTSGIGEKTDTQNFLLLDLISLGVYSKLKAFANVAMFGAINMISALLNLPVALINIFKGIITIMYLIGVILLFTNRSIK